MNKYVHCGVPGTKDHNLFGGIREGFPEEGTLGQALKNHIGVGPRDDMGRECQVEGWQSCCNGMVRSWLWPERDLQVCV